MKCLVHGCENRDHQGTFVGNLCAPCYEMLKTGEVGFGTTFVHRLFEEGRDVARGVRSQVVLETTEAIVAWMRSIPPDRRDDWGLNATEELALQIEGLAWAFGPIVDVSEDP